MEIQKITPDNTETFFEAVNEEVVRKEVVRRGLDSRDWLTKASIAIMLKSSLLTFVLIFFQGFKIKGFTLPPEFLHWLGGATIGTLIANTLFLYKNLYNKSIFATNDTKN